MSKTIEEKINDIEGNISTIEGKTLEYKGVYQDDLNNLKETGFYYTNNATPDNSPASSFTYAQVVVLNSNDMIFQIGLSTPSKFYVRRYAGSPASWSDWYYYSGTVVS